MTAEVAIINKSAVALAADSAITISAGNDQEKIFDSADKLFELSTQNPIGVMVNGDMNFVQTPIAVLIKKFRVDCDPFLRINDAAMSFMRFLQGWAETTPASVIWSEARSILAPIVEDARSRTEARYVHLYIENSAKYESEGGLVAARKDALEEALKAIVNYMQALPDAEFLDSTSPQVSDEYLTFGISLFKSIDGINTHHEPLIAEICMLSVLKASRKYQSSMGLVVAGYGSEELFPTLVSFEIFGAPCGHLKYTRTKSVDIGRDGDRAEVIPFAQGEMVERFLYGLDEAIENDIGLFCIRGVPQISKKLIGSLTMDEDERSALQSDAEAAEISFFNDLKTQTFDAIRQRYRAEIEDMVEFMPKQEMARMAEALVNLTSIKRRVSRGMETVGGPIDVAVISQAEGFVWIQRKHYFPPELNGRYFDRISHKR